MPQPCTPPHAEHNRLSEQIGGRIDYLCPGSACPPSLPALPRYRKHLRMERQRAQGLLNGPQQPNEQQPGRSRHLPWKRTFRYLLWAGASHRMTSFKPQHDLERQAPPIKWKRFIGKDIGAQKSRKLPRSMQRPSACSLAFHLEMTPRLHTHVPQGLIIQSLNIS